MAQHHRSFRWCHACSGRKTSQCPIYELLSEGTAVVTHEAAGLVRKRSVQRGSLLEVVVDGPQGASRDGHVARLGTLCTGAHLEEHLLPVALHASDVETDEFTDAEPTVRQRSTMATSGDGQAERTFERWGSGGRGEEPLDLARSERQHFAGEVRKHRGGVGAPVSSASDANSPARLPGLPPQAYHPGDPRGTSRPARRITSHGRWHAPETH